MEWLLKYQRISYLPPVQCSVVPALHTLKRKLPFPNQTQPLKMGLITHFSDNVAIVDAHLQLILKSKLHFDKFHLSVSVQQPTPLSTCIANSRDGCCTYDPNQFQAHFFLSLSSA